MFLFLYYACGLHIILLQFYCDALNEKPEGAQRFIVEEDWKPAIFGSNKFNPILQIFEDVNTVHDAKNDTVIGVTEIGDQGAEMTTATPTSTTHRVLFRKHVTPATVKSNKWWARAKTRTRTTTRSNLDHRTTQPTLEA